MAIKKILNNKYKVDISMGKDSITKKRKRFIKSNIETYSKAKKIEAESMERMAKKSSEMSLKELYIMYLEKQKSYLKENSIIKKDNIFRNHIKDFFYSKKIQDITVRDIEDYKLYLSNKDISNNYKRQVLIALKTFFNYLVKYDYIDHNIFNKVDNFKKEKVVMKFWTINEFNLFIEKVDDIILFTFFNVLFYTGMRKGEALALKWTDIDFLNKRIYIDKSCSYITGKGYVTSKPKTNNSIRYIFIHDYLIDVLKDLYEYKLKTEPNFKDSDYVFGINNELLSKSTITRYFRTYTNQAGVKQIRIHDLRHSHVALLIHLKQDPLVIKKRLGHSDIAITLNVYGHLYDEKDREVIDILDEVNKL